MSTLPSEIRIKRKATDDPVELLHVHNEGNTTSNIRQYVFKRQRTSLAPQIQSSTYSSSLHAADFSVATSDMAASANPRQCGGERNGSGTRLAATTEYEKGAKALDVLLESNHSAEAPAYRASVDSSSKLQDVPSVMEPRRFHLARDSTISTSGGNLSGRRRRPRGSPTVFIERKRPPTHSVSHLHSTSKFSSSSPGRSEESIAASGFPQLENSASLKAETIGSGELMAKSAKASGLSAEMLAYVNQEPEQKYAESSMGSNVSQLPQLIKTREVSSFKERSPALKPQQPHLGHPLATEQSRDYDHDEVMVDAIEPEDEDLDYVMDIYVRMPAQMIELQDQKNYGLLVWDPEPDTDGFYQDDSDDKSETYEDDEDENAENHPSNDYPDEEDAFKDEYEHERYDYRDRNSFDTQEFNDDVSSSDGDTSPGRVRRPWMMNNAY